MHLFHTERHTQPRGRKKAEGSLEAMAATWTHFLKEDKLTQVCKTPARGSQQPPPLAAQKDQGRQPPPPAHLSCLFSCAARRSSWMFLVICSVFRMTSSVLGRLALGWESLLSGVGPAPCQRALRCWLFREDLPGTHNVVPPGSD